MTLIEQIKNLVNRVENEDHWITIGAEEGKKGHHVLVKDGETNKEATERKIAEWEGKEDKEAKKEEKKSFEDLGFKKGEQDRWHLKKDGKMHTIVRTTPNKYRYVVSEWDDKKGSGKDLFDKTSLTEEELNKEINKFKSQPEEEKKHIWKDKEYTKEELVGKGFHPMKYSASIYENGHLTWLEKTEGNHLYRVKITEDEYRRLKPIYDEKNNKKAKNSLADTLCEALAEVILEK